MKGLAGAISDAIANGIEIHFNKGYKTNRIECILKKDNIIQAFVYSQDFLTDDIANYVIAREVHIHIKRLLNMEKYIRKLKEETNEQA